MIDRISKIICKPNSDMSLRHYVVLQKSVEVGDNYKKQRFKELGYMYVYNYDDKTVNKQRTGLFLMEEDYISVQSDIKVDEKGNPTVPPICRINQLELQRSLDGVEECYKWLSDDTFKGIFTVDTKGDTVGVAKNIYYTVNLKYNRFLMFQPAVIYDIDGLSYQGIKVSCDKGVIGSMTALEFESFRLSFKEICNNFYTASLALMNLGISIINMKRGEDQ